MLAEQGPEAKKKNESGKYLIDIHLAVPNDPEYYVEKVCKALREKRKEFCKYIIIVTGEKVYQGAIGFSGKVFLARVTVCSRDAGSWKNGPENVCIILAENGFVVQSISAGGSYFPIKYF